MNAISTLLFYNTDHADALYGWKRVDNDQLASEEDRCIGFMKHGKKICTVTMRTF